MILPLALNLLASLSNVTAPQPSVPPLLDDLQHRAVRFFWEHSNPHNGFTKDRARNSDAAPPNNIASSASVGFALSAYVIGTERHWLDRTQALNRTRITLKNLMTTWPHQKGWLYHFVDYNTGVRAWKCEASTIDTSICFAGVIVAEQYWKDPQITKDAEAFAKRMDWNFVVKDGGLLPESTTVSMGWHPESGFINARWNNWDELKMIYVQGYGFSDMSTDGWAKIERPYVNYKGIEMLAGGPLFMHEMSESFYDFKGLRDPLGYNYWVESRNAALGNRQYCIDNPKHFAAYGPNFWGLSACDVPDGYAARGAPGYIDDDGTITPTSAVAAIQFAPDLAISFAKTIRKEHPEAWGRYGFPNGYNPSKNWVDSDVIGIDLGMMLTAVENFRSGLIARLSMSNPKIRRGFSRLGFKLGADDVLQAK